MLSVEQIEAFITTVETGSFSGAARRLGKVQSAVSQNIMNLEIDCGVELFDRRGRYPVLTEAGEKLLPYARAAMVQHGRLAERVDSLTQKEIQPIVLTIDEGIPFDWVTPIIQTLSEEFPRLSWSCFSHQAAMPLRWYKMEEPLPPLFMKIFPYPFRSTLKALDHYSSMFMSQRPIH
ncbi:transcriptional regulator LysR family [Vibrio maritimus]|uniref:Transcriptional regulator LysR family n=1 Tax=Vibrio maritimus TaxID=990268 RepID=A0A090T6S0_9VIBR|nr:transcriptional regulator LysR family [Vibrio maritimus]